MDFVRSISALFQQCATSISNDLQLKDTLCTQLGCVLTAVEEALCALDSTPYEEDLESLRQIWVCAKEHHRVLLSSLNTCSVTSSTIIPLQHVLCTGSPGRPRLIVNIEQVELLRSAEFTWEHVAQVLGVSRTGHACVQLDIDLETSRGCACRSTALVHSGQVKG